MKWLPALVLLLGLVVILAGFVYDVLFAGIPYQDPTPELAARYAFDCGVAEVILGAGGVIFGLGLLVSFARCISSRVKRETGITMYSRDTENDTNTLGVDMLRKPLPGLSSGENVGLSVYSNLIDYGTYQSDTTPEESRAVVDNSQYAYYLSVYIYAAPAYLQLQAVRVDYSFGAALPLIQR